MVGPDLGLSEAEFKALVHQLSSSLDYLGCIFTMPIIHVSQETPLQTTSFLPPDMTFFGLLYCARALATQYGDGEALLEFCSGSTE